MKLQKIIIQGNTAIIDKTVHKILAKQGTQFLVISREGLINTIKLKQHA